MLYSNIPQSRAPTGFKSMPLRTVTYVLRRHSGLTLIELLVVIAIVAILSAIAVPSFMSTTQKYRTTSEANSFFVDLQFARSEAIRRGEPIVICASINGTSCSNTTNWQGGWITGTDPAAGAITVLRKQAAFSSTDKLTSTVGSVLFNRDGFTSGLGATNVVFQVQTSSGAAAATQCVSLSSVGRQKKGCSP